MSGNLVVVRGAVAVKQRQGGKPHLSISLWRVAVLSLALLSLACGARRPKDPSRKLHVEVAAEAFHTANGYLFLSVFEPDSRIVRIDLRYPVGSGDDPQGKEGLAHFTEHLLYELEVKRGKRKTTLWAESGRLASSFNAETHADYIHFESQGSPESLEGLLQIEGERLTTPCMSISKDIFAREKEVVLNELRERLDPDGGSLSTKITKAIFPVGHLYGKTESLESIQGIQLQDVCEFLSTTFRKGQATVVISGPVTGAQVKTIASRTLAGVAARSDNRPAKAAPVTHDGGMDTLYADVAEPILLAAFPMPTMGTRDYQLAMLAKGDLEASLGSTAYQYGWGHNARTWVAGGGDAPQLMLGITLRSKDKLSEAKEGIGLAIRGAYRGIKYGNEKKDSIAWQERLASEEASLLSRYEALPERGYTYSDYLLYDGNLELLLGKLNNLRSTSPREVRKITESWIANSKSKRILVLPREASEGSQKLSSVFAPIHSKNRGIAVDPREADKPLKVPSDTGLGLSLERYVGKNGLEVIFWPHGKLPLLHARLVTRAGMAMDRRGKEGTALVAGFDDVYEDSMVFGNRMLRTLIDRLLHEITLELRSPGQGIGSKVRKHLQSRLKLRGSKERVEYGQQMLVALYGEGHPYARPAMTAKSIKTLTLDNIQGWARKHVVPANSTLILVGQFDPEYAKKWVSYFSDHLDAGKVSAPVDVEVPVDTPRWIVGKGNSLSSTLKIDVRFLGGKGIDNDAATRQIVRSILGGKLDRMRANHALTYGMGVRYIPRVGGGYWEISGEVDASRAKEAGRVLAATLAEFRASSDSYRGSFVLARRKLVAGYLARANDSNSIINRIEFMARFELPDDYYQRLVSKIANSNLESVQTLINNELSSQRQITGAFGPPAAAEAFMAGMKEADVGS